MQAKPDAALRRTGMGCMYRCQGNSNSWCSDYENGGNFTIGDPRKERLCLVVGCEVAKRHCLLSGSVVQHLRAPQQQNEDSPAIRIQQSFPFRQRWPSPLL